MPKPAAVRKPRAVPAKAAPQREPEPEQAQAGQEQAERKQPEPRQPNPRQRRFADEYLVDLNATRAAIRAGYSEHTARQLGARNVKNPVIAAYIEAGMNKRQERVERTALDVLADIEAVKDDAMQKVPDRDGNMSMVNHNAALKALELEGKHRKMFTDKIETSGPNGGPVKVDLTVTPERAYLELIGK
jgi:phage terminase small subunit